MAILQVPRGPSILTDDRTSGEGVLERILSLRGHCSGRKELESTLSYACILNFQPWNHSTAGKCSGCWEAGCHYLSTQSALWLYLY